MNTCTWHGRERSLGKQQECYPLADKTCPPLLPRLLFCSWTFHAGESVERDHRAKTGLDSCQTPLKRAYSHWSGRTTIRPTDYSSHKPPALRLVMLSGTSESSQLPGNQKSARPMKSIWALSSTAVLIVRCSHAAANHRLTCMTSQLCKLRSSCLLPIPC